MAGFSILPEIEAFFRAAYPAPASMLIPIPSPTSRTSYELQRPYVFQSQTFSFRKNIFLSFKFCDFYTNKQTCVVQRFHVRSWIVLYSSFVHELVVTCEHARVETRSNQLVFKFRPLPSSMFRVQGLRIMIC